MGDNIPVLVWLRRDLRLGDNPALAAAVASGRPVIPVFIADEMMQDLGAAPDWRLKLGVAHFDRVLRQVGSRVLFRIGSARQILQQLVAETGATGIYWNRAYHPDEITRDTNIKSDLKALGIEVKSFPGNLCFEPWTVAKGSGGGYRVFTPFWRSVRQLSVAASAPAPAQLRSPQDWPKADDLQLWAARHRMGRGVSVVRPYLSLGEQAAWERLETFCDDGLSGYSAGRDIPSRPATSGLSEALACGEISARQIWHRGRALWQDGAVGAETFLKQLVWREFAYHLMFHEPHILTRNWRQEWDGFPWNQDDQHPDVIAWKQGRTGIAFVDAAMREMYVTGRMHNRGRMIVASYLSKHLMTDWRIGQRWFADCLTDWDPASNAMGWQWAAGSGPDAAPYFRVFNPELQLKKFDPDGRYRRGWIAEGQAEPSETALSYFDAIPKSWNMRAGNPYPTPIVSAAKGRERALAAYQNRGF
ncbi:Deoxyribodipyrimidine photo-lyase [Thalassovita gelatinovora]|uniref:Deoxyribodipyrimidine photo-lyase n=1 Tax=Thalassovita gelatinovora TaxID=53501 RepID=A0A0P1FL00_THAGE|nr:deoxyribodipyrimidine photo-lyase [Thalassovita gelatinovora]QIZ79129.1 deoxyribodipyrimidine photo-lyase [Thalassovita gelatinovora]CUH68792.1 Deoxyribodipyrimidine photo-lyase [Thalassovita gelatinovora]SEQ58858.1 deoxyribodipyrimidine photo-lyase [Thalassovita gelatinovora]